MKKSTIIIIIVVLIFVIIGSVTAIVLLQSKETPNPIPSSNTTQFKVIGLKQQFENVSVDNNENTKNKINSIATYLTNNAKTGINPGTYINYWRQGKVYLPGEFRVVLEKDGQPNTGNSNLILTRTSGSYSYPTTLALFENPISLKEGEKLQLQFKGVMDSNQSGESFRTDSSGQYEFINIYPPFQEKGVSINYIAFTKEGPVYGKFS